MCSEEENAFYKCILIHLTHYYYGDINDTTMGYPLKKKPVKVSE